MRSGDGGRAEDPYISDLLRAMVVLPDPIKSEVASPTHFLLGQWQGRVGYEVMVGRSFMSLFE